MKKTLLWTIFLGIISVFLLADAGFAGTKSRHRWQGFALGWGASALASSLFFDIHIPWWYDDWGYRRRGYQRHGYRWRPYRHWPEHRYRHPRRKSSVKTLKIPDAKTLPVYRETSRKGHYYTVIEWENGQYVEKKKQWVEPHTVFQVDPPK